ncbi:23S rRNA (adenine(2503)-C(2))-methyltransferase RlmN [Acidobacteriota bacterium]
MSNKERINLAGTSISEIEHHITPHGLKPFRARQIFSWIYKRACFDFAGMTDISRPTRELLASNFSVTFPTVTAQEVEETGTRKIALSLEDGHVIEAVLIPDRRHDTICLSTQVGCPLRCAFCLSGAKGFKRNLEPHEIIGQFLILRPKEWPERPVNAVLMGMGEPCLNLDSVRKAVSILKDELGTALSWRRTTLSTAGVVPAIRAFREWKPRPKLAISINAASDEVRSRIMPINKKYPLKELMAELKSFPLRRGERITFEYVLMKKINDSVDEAKRLASLIRGIPSKINLIPMNPLEEKSFKPPGEETIQAFEEVLRRKGFTVVRRRSRGTSISAACGQLAMRNGVRS